MLWWFLFQNAHEGVEGMSFKNWNFYLCSALANAAPYKDHSVHGISQFCVCAQPMRDSVTPSLIGWVHTQNDSCSASVW